MFSELIFNLTQKSLSSPCDIEQEGGKMSEEIREVKDKG